MASGGSAQLGEARIDIVADDRALAPSLQRAEGKVRASARRMGQSVGRGIGGSSFGGGAVERSRYSLFNPRGDDSFMRDVGRIRTAISTTLFAAAVGAGIATVIDRHIGGNEDSLLKINAETVKERLRQGEEEYARLSAQAATQKAPVAGDSTKGWLADIINSAYASAFKLWQGDAEARRDALRPGLDTLRQADAEARKRVEEAEKRNRMYENMTRVEDARQQMVQRFTEAVDGLERATQNLRQGFQLNDVGATIAAIRDDIAIQTSTNAALYYNGGYVGGLASYFGRGR